jgi:uncharacterized membrane protein
LFGVSLLFIIGSVVFVISVIAIISSVLISGRFHFAHFSERQKPIGISGIMSIDKSLDFCLSCINVANFIKNI